MSSTEVELVYFAWLRERVGKDRERFVLPAEVTTPADLMAHLASRDEGYAHAFENPDVVRVAIDKRVCEPDARFRNPREIAFFPPMTGG